jgi:hypothetical protein
MLTAGGRMQQAAEKALRSVLGSLFQVRSCKRPRALNTRSLTGR